MKDDKEFTTIYIRKDIFAELKAYQHKKILDTPYEAIEYLLKNAVK